MQAVKTFRKEKPKSFLHSQFTAGTYNIDGLPAFIQVAADCGIQEVLMRFVQNHTTAREDVSLRFARDRTERAIEAAREIAEREKVWFTVERRPYSEEMPNEAEAPVNPLSRLRRYLDFVPFSIGPGGSGSGGTTGGGDVPCPQTGGVPIIFPGLFSVDSGKPVIIRRPRAPRRPAPGQQATAYSPAALVVAWDGALWSCFAGHAVGNVFEDDLASVVANPRYQAFLQNRQTNGTLMQERWCRNCPRTH
jgi:MoaA/NifB/PqqE/SkfB family radical SAM enzyme